jgi:serine/threonine protein kinase
MSVAAEFVGSKNAMEEATGRMSPREKLSVAIEIAQAIADVHSIARLAHNDLHSDNLFFTPDKRLKVGDFNQGVLFTEPNKTGEMCLSPGSSWMSFMRRPEEQKKKYSSWVPFLRGPEQQKKKYIRGVGKANGVMPDKVDINFLGNTLFTLTVGHEPWMRGGSRAYKDWAAKQKMQGKLPGVPLILRTSRNPAVQALLEAVEACYRYEPKARTEEVAAHTKTGRLSKKCKESFLVFLLS